LPDLLAPAARLTSRYGAVVVLGWIVVAAVGNLAVPQLERVVASHSRSFMPTTAASLIAATRSAELFGDVPSNNLSYVVLEGDRPLRPVDRRYYDTLVAALRADSAHVTAVTDLWSARLTESAALSHDRHAAAVMLRLTGMLGTSAAADSVAAVRHTVARLGLPAGLHVYVTGPGATITDEFTAIDRQMLLITAATIAVIMVLLLIVYRSPIAAAIPLMSVGLALAVARPIVAVLGEHSLVEVSLFSVALIAAMLLGAGTDYAIFLIGRYHEGRRRGIDPATALEQAYRGVAPVIVGSSLTIAVALACLSLAKVGMFRSVGIPCAIGILTGMLAALTLTPALIDLAGRRGLLEPRPSMIARRWRRVGVIVARWPGPVLVATGLLVIVLALPVTGLRPGWNEPAATPAGADSSRGYQVMDRHFAANRLFPDVVTVAADHDLRNSPSLIAIERITRQIMAIPGVRMVQSASRPAGTVPDEATLSHQADLLGKQFGAGLDSLVNRLQRVGDLDAMLSRMAATVDQMSRGMAGSAAGLGEIGSGADDMRAGMDGLQTSITTVSEYLNPLRGFVNNTADCAANPICSLVSRVVEPINTVVRSSAELSSGTVKLTSGTGTASAGLAGLPQTLQSMRDVLGQARAATSELREALGSIGPQVQQLTDYLRELDTGFRGSAAGGFYLPSRALSDPRYAEALKYLMSADGRASYLLVYGDGQEWGADGAKRTEQVRTAVAEATKEGTLTPTEVDLAGVGPVTSDLEVFVAHDFRLLVVATLALIFLIVAVMLRSPVAAAAVMGTVIVSYASAVAVSGLVCRQLLSQELHWAVAPIAFIALVAVGADYNLLLAMRIREEARAGIGTGIVRAFAGTGGVVTTAGIVFGITMFALMASTVLPVAQTGLAVGVGLLLDTLIVRIFLMPSLVALLGRWFWWPVMSGVVSPMRTLAIPATRRAGSLMSA
jgi:putative drug exporter of the RND superfamily